MPFYLNEDRAAVMEIARQFAQKDCAPLAEEIDREDRFPLELFRKAGELGLLGIGIPEELGGSGLDTTTLCLVAEEISKTLPALAQIIMSHTGLSLMSLMQLNDKATRDEWLPKAAQGKAVGVCCMTEPCGNSDMTGWKTTAVKDGDDWIINGGKIFCTNVGAADYYIVSAKTDKMDLSKGYGATGFFVPKGTKGARVEHIEDKIGWRGSSTGSIYFDNVRVPDKYRVGPVNMHLAAWDSRPELIAEGACALGIAEAAYEATKTYAKQRLMPNGIPYYYYHETMRTRITEMKMKIEAIRGMVYMFADMADRGENVAPDFMMIKPYTASLAQDICSVAIDLHGGNGVCKECKIEKYWREAKVCMIGGGQYDIQMDSAGLMS